VALRVITFCTYCKGGGYTEQDTYHAAKFVKAIKGDGVNGWAEIPVPIGGRRQRLEEGNRGAVFGWFGEMAAASIPARPLVLVPVPGSKAITTDEVRAGPTFRLARAVAMRCSRPVETLLRWRRPMQSARSGGERRAEVLLPNLVVDGEPTAPVVLVDDVCTSGGHLQAASAAIRGAGGEVLFAVCAAQSESTEQPGGAFAVRERELEDVDP
jgi:hypothetical protein